MFNLLTGWSEGEQPKNITFKVNFQRLSCENGILWCFVLVVLSTAVLYGFKDICQSQCTKILFCKFPLSVSSCAEKDGLSARKSDHNAGTWTAASLYVFDNVLWVHLSVRTSTHTPPTSICMVFLQCACACALLSGKTLYRPCCNRQTYSSDCVSSELLMRFWK